MSAGSNSSIGKLMLQPGRELAFLIDHLVLMKSEFILKKSVVTLLSLVPGLSSPAPQAGVYPRQSNLPRRHVSGAESHLTELDRIVGDGDMGISLARGAKAIERDLHSYDLDNPAATLAALSRTLREALSRSSGPLMPSFSCVQPRNWNIETWVNDPRHSGLERSRRLPRHE